MEAIEKPRKIAPGWFTPSAIFPRKKRLKPFDYLARDPGLEPQAVTMVEMDE
jgi:hypothetical protein